MSSKLIFVAYLLAFASVAVAADPALERVATALKVNDLKSVRYAGDGYGWTFGQAYKPGEAWAQDQAQFMGAHGQL